MIQKTIHFGTDGIRGNASEFPFTHDALTILGQVIASWSHKKYATTLQPQILLGHDTRKSCERIKNALIQGLKSESVTIVDAGVIPTPAIFKIMQTNSAELPELNAPFNLGIVISASHNPADDNGIKFFDARTGKLNPEDEQELEDAFCAAYQKGVFLSTHNNAQVITWPYAEQTYKEQIIKHFTPHFLAGKTIVLDCAHGATSTIAQTIFKHLGATVVSFFASPNGTNINDNCGAVHPEIVAELVKKHNAYAGFAFDGDGDRVIAINQHGTIKDGDDLLAILLENQELAQSATVVGTLMTNHGFDLHLQNKNKKLIRTKVGDKYIAAAMEKEGLLLGGETSGHIIIGTYLMSGDGIFTALKLLETMIIANNHEMHSFIKLPQTLLNIPIQNKNNLNDEPYATLIATYKAELLRGRIIIRYSDTEPLLRIMTEAENQELAHSMAQKLATELTLLLATPQIQGI